MSSSMRRFRHFPHIFIDPKMAWGNPTLGRTRVLVFKVWEMVKADEMDSFMEKGSSLTIGDVNAVMQFVDWCLGLGLMRQLDSGRLCYDKDALYRASILECPPRGQLCLYCNGFIPYGSHAWTEVRDAQRGSEEAREGVAHGACLQAVVLDEPAPKANVLT